MQMRAFARVTGVAVFALITVLSARAADAAAATDLRIRFTAGSHRVGMIATYNVTVTNMGPGTTDEPIHVLDTLPAGLSFAGIASAGWACTTSGPTVDCVMDAPVGPGTTKALKLRLAVCTAAYPSVTNTLRVSYAGDTNSANNSLTRTKVVRNGSCTPLPATPTFPPTATPLPGTPGTSTRTFTPTPTPTSVPATADLQLTKTTSSTFTVGGTGLYTLTVLNLGPATTNGVITLIDTLPQGLTYLSSSGSGWTCSASAQTVTCTTPNPLLSGGSTGVTLTVAVGAAAYPTVTNIATVSYAGDPNGANNTRSKPTTIRQ